MGQGAGPKRVGKPEDSYVPFFCPGCKVEPYQTVTLQIKCPVGWRDLSKHGIRSRKVKIEAAFWDEASWHCNCGLMQEFMERREQVSLQKQSTLRRKPGTKWTPRVKRAIHRSEER